MSSSPPGSNVLLEFDPLSTPAGDPAPSSQSGGEKCEPKAPQGDPQVSNDERVPQSTPPTDDQIAPKAQNDSLTSPSVKPTATPTADVTTPQSTVGDSRSAPRPNTDTTKASKDTPTSGHVTGTKDTPSGGSASGKKKKKKKKHSSDKASKQSSKSPVRNLGVKGHLSTMEINTEMNQIDQFLQSLKMGTYDPLNPQSSAVAALGTTTTTTTTSILPPPVVGGATSTTGIEEGGVATAGEGGARSLGMQLIGQLESSSSSDSWDSSSDSSDEDSEDEEESAVAIE